jgi:hypothetical protein
LKDRLIDADDPNCPRDWKELYSLHRQFERSTDSDERFEIGKRITELSKLLWAALGRALSRCPFKRTLDAP